jgi:hypothetical protein
LQRSVRKRQQERSIDNFGYRRLPRQIVGLRDNIDGARFALFVYVPDADVTGTFTESTA